jgi:uncharacterized cofD-like protein
VVADPILDDPVVEELARSGLLTDAEGPHVVCVGGGHGLALALQATVSYADSVSAIVTVADDGGSSGRLVPDLDIPPPGDIRRCLVALSPQDSVWRRLFEYRFEGADVEGHSLGNLIIAALADLEGGFETAVLDAEQLLGTLGSVIPVAPEPLRLVAEIDGVRVAGQDRISGVQGHIDSITLEPAGVAASPRAVDALISADQIVLGPGSLYTSLIATLAVPGLVEAIGRSRANLVYVGNMITQDAETLGMDAVDHIRALLDLTGLRPPNAIVAESGQITVPPPLEAVRVDPDVLATFGVDVVFAELADPATPWPQHDPARLGRVLAGLAERRS